MVEKRYEGSRGVKMAKKPKAKVRQQTSKNLRRNLLIIPSIVLLAKFIWIAAMPGHGLLGADGENYLSALDGLIKDGFTSDARNLHYWPAGYPLLMWPIAALFKSQLLPVVAIIQSTLYFLGSIYFVDQLRVTRLARFAVPTSLILALNPTLSMNSVAIGYETPTAALLLIAMASLIRHFNSTERKPRSRDVIIGSISFSLATFMQPRLIIIAFISLLIWGFATQAKKSLLAFVVISFVIVAIAPGIMIIRNQQAMGFTSISTNLGTTMFIGIGDEATGGYNGKYNGVPCPAAEKGNEAQVDSAKVKCAILWDLKNPGKFFKLAISKAIFFWSPWFGPVANGTMARNPWLKIDPFKNMATTQEGANTVFGGTGKLVSWLWLIGQLFLLFYGFRYLWRADGLERLLGLTTFAAVVLNWLISIGTIGDHRFRIPTMGLSLFLQIVGFMALFGGKSRLVGSQTPLRWKTFERNANLQP